MVEGRKHTIKKASKKATENPKHKEGMKITKKPIKKVVKKPINKATKK